MDGTGTPRPRLFLGTGLLDRRVRLRPHIRRGDHRPGQQCRRGEALPPPVEHHHHKGRFAQGRRTGARVVRQHRRYRLAGLHPQTGHARAAEMGSLPRPDEGRHAEKLPLRHQRIHGLVRGDLDVPQQLPRRGKQEHPAPHPHREAPHRREHDHPARLALRATTSRSASTRATPSNRW